MFEVVTYDILAYILIGPVLIFFLLCLIERYFYKRLINTDLSNKHVVITGGSSGIGKSLAIEAVLRGANVTLIARDEEKLNIAKQEILQHCVHSVQHVFLVSLDVSSSYEEIEKSITLIEQENGPIFMLVNCAGKAVCGKLEDLSASDIRNLCELNYTGSILMAKSVVEGMKSRGEGHIVFTSSSAGLLGIYGLTAYSASKFALRGLAEALHMETQCYGVKVTIAYPPDTDTPGFAIEEQGKPKETKLICQSGGLIKPSVVAKQIIQDALAGKFTSFVGMEGLMLTTVTAGMSPCYSLRQLVTEIFLMGIFRAVGVKYLHSFKWIIQRCLIAKNQSKKAE